MGCVNKNYPLIGRVACLEEAKEEKKNELSAFVFLQKVAAFTGRVQTEYNNHRYKND
jgi:hypothetical protein